MLLSWNESSTRGRTITLLLPEDEESHPFRDLTTKSGKRAGQRFMVVFVQLNDQDEPQMPRLSQVAGALCRSPDFWSWINDSSWEAISSEEDAKQYIYRACNVTSRSHLDTDERAAHLFRLLDAEYRKSRRVFR
jgi:hypothetical protein